MLGTSLLHDGSASVFCLMLCQLNDFPTGLSMPWRSLWETKGLKCNVLLSNGPKESLECRLCASSIRGGFPRLFYLLLRHLNETSCCTSGYTTLFFKVLGVTGHSIDPAFRFMNHEYFRFNDDDKKKSACQRYMRNALISLNWYWSLITRVLLELDLVTWSYLYALIQKLPTLLSLSVQFARW